MHGPLDPVLRRADPVFVTAAERVRKLEEWSREGADTPDTAPVPPARTKSPNSTSLPEYTSKQVAKQCYLALLVRVTTGLERHRHRRARLAGDVKSSVVGPSK